MYSQEVITCLSYEIIVFLVSILCFEQFDAQRNLYGGLENPC